MYENLKTKEMFFKKIIVYLHASLGSVTKGLCGHCQVYILSLSLKYLYTLRGYVQKLLIRITEDSYYEYKVQILPEKIVIIPMSLFISQDSQYFLTLKS